MNQKIKTQNRLLSLLLVLVLVFGMIPITGLNVAAASTATYNGTPVTPTKITSSNYTAFGLTESNWEEYNGWYGIRSAAELYGFAELVNGGETTANGVLLQDVALNAGTITENGSSSGQTYMWPRIGNASNTFKGNFDGNGCTISGVYCIGDTGVGLFGVIGKSASNTSVTIKNIVLKNSYINGTVYIGGIVGVTCGYGASISNCKICEDVTICKNTDGNIPYIGGIVGGYSGLSNVLLYKYKVTCSVTNCVNLGTVKNAKVVFTQDSLANSGSQTFLYSGAITGDYAEEDNAFEFVPVSNCYYIKGRLVDKNGSSVDRNGNTFTCGRGGTYNRRDNTGCTSLSSISDSHTCVSVTHKEVKATHDYPGCSEYSYCLVCGKVTSGTKTEYSASSEAHEPKFVYEIVDSNTHNKYYACCGVKACTENHTFLSSEKDTCKYCGALLSKPTVVTNENYKDLGLDSSYIGYYAIQTVSQLYWFASLTNGTLTDGTAQNIAANAVLLKDLTVNENVIVNGALATDTSGFIAWTPIGDYANNGNITYSGTFDGNNHTVRGLYAVTSTGSLGFFGRANNSVKNLIISDSYFESSDNNVGGIVGFMETNGAIERCSSVNCIVKGNKYVGGIAGVLSNGNLATCYSTSILVASNFCGGIVGFTQNTSTIQSCYFAGKIDCSGSYRCGITMVPAVDSTNVTVKDCYYDNKINTTSAVAKTSSSLAGTLTKKAVGSAATGTFESGKIAYLLNGSKPDGAWKQTLGTDTYPNFTGDTVYVIPKDCGGNDGTVYTNTKPDAIAHQYNSNGLCYETENQVHYQPAVWNEMKNRYEIENAGQFVWFSQLVNGTLTDGTPKNQSANAILAKDIDMSDVTGYTPIGTTGLYYSAEGEDKGYSGTFDGNGHVIKNLTFTGSSSAELTYGIFGTLSGSVKNLGVENMNFTRGNSDCRAGGIVGQIITGGSVTSCFVANTTIDANGKVAGGIAGCNYAGTITNCHTYKVAVTATRAGGIVGDNRGDGGDTDRLGTVSNCYTTASDIQNSQRTGNVSNCTAGIDDTDFSSGKITWLLNGKSVNGVWKQILNANLYPNFTGETVYVVPTDCGGKNGTAFSNTAQTAIAHVYDSNGLCRKTADEVHYEPAEFDTNSNAYKIANLGNLLWFRDQVNGGNTKINAILTADIDGQDDAAKIIGIGTNGNPFEGVFDGNGKTLDIRIVSTEQYAAPFAYVNGATIKNLTVTGSITSSQKFAASFIGATTGGTVILEKCISKVMITSTVNGDGTNGGLVANVGGGEMKINNCAFAGAYVTSTATSSGGFVGWTNKNAKTYITNSFLVADFSGAKTDGCNTFSRNPGYVTVNNCYYLTALGDVPDGATQKSSTAFENGEVTWLLNRASSDGVWKQTLGEGGDALPNFTGKAVYKVAASCDPSEAATYSNVFQSTPEHSYDSDGFCVNCKDYQPAVWNESKYAYEISNAGQLYWFAALTNGTLRDGTAQNPSANAALKNDIKVNTGVIVNGALASDTSGFHLWTPIGNYNDNGNKNYIGTFDGNGHTISGLYMLAQVKYSGFIGSVSTGSTIKNLTVADSYFKTTQENIGAISGYNEGTIERCASVNCIISGTNRVGGIAGTSYDGTIKNCVSQNCTVNGNENVGGIAGFASGKINNSASVDCTISGTKFIGGIAGTLSTMAVSNCYSNSQIKATSERGCGIGWTQLTCTISNCYFTGSITGTTKYVAAITYMLSYKTCNVTVNDCYYISTISVGAAKAGSKGTLETNRVEAKTADQFKSGEVAWLLNGSSSTGVWKQTLSSDIAPNFTGLTVYYDAGHNPNYYNKDSDKIASVTIVWTDMSFSYNKGTWDTETMTWEGGGWEADAGCGTVTVTNTGSLDVIAQFGVDLTDDSLGISVSFTENDVLLEDKKIKVLAGKEKTVTVKLTGDEPSEYIETATTIGQITIALSTE